MNSICAIYICREAEGLETCRRFAESLARTEGEFDLHVVFKGFKDNLEFLFCKGYFVFKDITFSYSEMPDKGYDLTAYRQGAEMVSNPILVFFNSSTEILDTRWPEHYQRALSTPGIGLVGATASWESFQRGWLRRLLFSAFPNPHVRTNAFAMRRDTFLRLWPKYFRTKNSCYLFESGINSLTRRIWALKQRAVVMDSSGALWDWPEWGRFSPFRSDRHNLVASDNQTRMYEQANEDMKKYLKRKAWGHETVV